MRVACFDILGRRNGCCKGTPKGNDEAGRSGGGLVLGVHWLTGEWPCMYDNSQQSARANVEIRYAGTKQRAWKSEIGIVC
jgi:hypothetical protein